MRERTQLPFLRWENSVSKCSWSWSRATQSVTAPLSARQMNLSGLQVFSCAWGSQVPQVGTTAAWNGEQLSSKQPLTTTGLDQRHAGWDRHWTLPAELFDYQCLGLTSKNSDLIVWSRSQAGVFLRKRPPVILIQPFVKVPNQASGNKRR